MKDIFAKSSLYWGGLVAE